MEHPNGFWDTASLDYQLKNYIEPQPTPELIVSVEYELGYRLPESYIRLMQTQNGGCPVNTCFPTAEATSWAEDHIAITGLFGIGREKIYSLCGDLGSQFMIDEWEYPPIGIYFADCPSAGHDMVALDYRECGPEGEPCVVHVDQEGDYRITWLAPNFESFIQGLVNEDTYAEDPEETAADELVSVQEKPFGSLLQSLCDAFPDDTLPDSIRVLATKIVKEKGFFALHADQLSHLMYDVQFLLYSHSHVVKSEQDYTDAKEGYRAIIALANGFSTGGYAPGFVSDWMKEARQEGRIVETDHGLKFTPAARAEVLQALLDTVTTTE